MLNFCTFSPMKSGFILSTTVAVLLLYAPCTMAQVEEATGAADPGRTQRDILDLQKSIPMSPTYEVKEAILQKAPEGADKIVFKLNKLEIEGVTAYPPAALQTLYADKIGTSQSLANIYAISSDITNKYRNEGYILTQVYVPPQTIDGGIVKLKVVEGFVDKILIQGEKSATEAALVQKFAENVKMKGVLNAKDLERNLLLINDLPGVTARTILSPSKTTIGASDMTVIVERDREEAELAFDNYGSRYLGAYQGTAIGTLNSPFGHNERVSGQFVLGGDKDRLNELAYGSVTYEHPISRTGTKVRLQLSHVETRPGYDLEEFDVRGRSQYWSLGVSHPFIRTRDLNFFGRGSFDWRDVSSRNNVEAARKDKIRSLRAGANLQFVDTLIDVGVNAIDLEIAKGVDVLTASDKGAPNLSRERGDPQYTKANLSVQRLQRVTPTTNLLIAGEGQLSANALLSSEEFGVGGSNIGRAYDPSEIVGDDGISGKLELQVNKPYEIPQLHDYQLFAFLDSGKVWNQDATTSSDKVQSLTSIGLGIRADITEKTKADLEIAVPLTRDIDSRDDTDPRIFFNINHAF